MDADRKLSEHEAEQALKHLFRANGVMSAPEGMDIRIMQRIALNAKPAMVPEAALISPWMWILGGLGSLALAVFSYFIPASAVDPGPVEHVLSSLPIRSLRTALTSHWAFMGAASLGLLMALDAALRRMRLAQDRVVRSTNS